MKEKKHNIGMDEKPKMPTIGDYLDEEIVSWAVELLKEYEDIFPNIYFQK